MPDLWSFFSDARQPRPSRRRPRLLPAVDCLEGRQMLSHVEAAIADGTLPDTPMTYALLELHGANNGPDHMQQGGGRSGKAARVHVQAAKGKPDAGKRLKGQPNVDGKKEQRRKRLLLPIGKAERARREAERLEAERIARENAERAAREQMDREIAETGERWRLELERIERERVEAERIERERVAELQRLEAERLAREAPRGPVLSVSDTQLDFEAREGESKPQASRIIGIKNLGGSRLEYVINYDNRLTSRDLLDSNPHRYEISFDTTGLTAGIYRRTITITSNGGNAAVNITLTVTKPVEPPAGQYKYYAGYYYVGSTQDNQWLIERDTPALAEAKVLEHVPVALIPVASYSIYRVNKAYPFETTIIKTVRLR